MPIPSNLSAHGKSIFERVMSSLKGKKNPRTGSAYTDEERGRIAWSAVKKIYKKKGEKWIKKSEDDVIDEESENEDEVFSELLEFKAEDGKYCFKGYLSTFDIDLVNDLVTPECMKDMMMQINAGLDGKMRGIKGSKDHDVYWTGDQQRIPISKITSGKLDDKGLFIEGMFNTDHPEFKNIWNQVQNGFLDGLSIEYKAVDFGFKEVNGKKIRILNKVQLKGYGHTPRPANPYSTLTDFFVKSLVIEEVKNENEMVLEHLKKDSKTWMTLASKADEEAKSDLEMIKKLETKSEDEESEEDEDDEETQDETEEKKKPEENKMEVIKLEEKKEEVKAEPQPVPQTEVKTEVKEKVEVKAEQPKEEPKVELKSLEEQIKAIVKEELKSLVPEKKALSDPKEEKFEVKSESTDLVGYVVKGIGGR